MNSDRKTGLMVSFIDAMKPTNILKKTLYMFAVITVLSIREFIYYLNLAGEEGRAWWTAIFPAYYDGLAVIFTSIWGLIVDLASMQFNYINQDAYGNLIFGVLFILGAIYVVYQPVSLLLDILDGQKGETSSIFVKIACSLIAVVIISSIVYYSGGAESVLSTIDTNTTVENVTTNSTNISGETPTISLI